MVAPASAQLIPGVPTEKPSWAVRPVIPEARRKGVATALARRVLEHLSEKGMEQVEAQALAGMPGGSELLTSLGFEPCGGSA